MKVLVLYRPNSEYSTATETFVRDFRRLHDVGPKLELISVDTRDGAALASLYDVMAYPSIIALGDDGRVLNMWQGPALPLMDEVAGYM